MKSLRKMKFVHRKLVFDMGFDMGMGNSDALPTPLDLQRFRSERAGSNQSGTPPQVPVSEAELVSPFGAIRWPMLITGLVGAVALWLFFTRTVDLGTVTVNWLIQFDVNWALCGLVILAGILALGPRLARNRGEWTSSNTILSLIITVAAAVLFGAHFIPLGTFEYTQKLLDFDTIAIYAICILLAALATRGGQVSAYILTAFIIWWAFTIDGFNLYKKIVELFTTPNSTRLIKEAFPPNWKVAFGEAVNPLFLTVQIAIGSLLLGVIGALPLSFLAARNTTPHPVIYNTIRAIVNTIRAIPSFFVALLLVPFVGLGAAPAIVGLGIHTISTLTKIFAESIESVKPEPLEALRAVGADGVKTFRWAVFPQALPLFASYTLYTFESIVRDSTVLAFVGGGGIGFLIYDNIQVLSYRNVAVQLAMLIVAVILMDRVSDYLRSKII